MSVGELSSREERPAYVRFERRPVEDKVASVAQGRYVARDVDFALITPPYSKDCVEHKVDKWFAENDRKVRIGRMPKEWAKMYRDAYQLWLDGQEIPEQGTPIKGWGLISPAQQEMLIRINCRTVEDLAAINDEGMKRIGMGALELKNKAVNWLRTLKDHGPLAMQVTTLETENKLLREQVGTLVKKVEQLQAALPEPVRAGDATLRDQEITAADLLAEDEPAPRRGRRAAQAAASETSI